MRYLISMMFNYLFQNQCLSISFHSSLPLQGTLPVKLENILKLIINRLSKLKFAIKLYHIHMRDRTQ